MEALISTLQNNCHSWTFHIPHIVEMALVFLVDFGFKRRMLKGSNIFNNFNFFKFMSMAQRSLTKLMPTWNSSPRTYFLLVRILVTCAIAAKQIALFEIW